MKIFVETLHDGKFRRKEIATLTDKELEYEHESQRLANGSSIDHAWAIIKELVKRIRSQQQ